MYSAHYVCTYKLRVRAAGLHSVRLYLKVAIFEPELQECTPRTTFALKSYDFPAAGASLRFLSRRAAGDQAGIEPATAPLREQAREPRDNFQRPVRKQQIRTAPQRERFDNADGHCGAHWR